MKMGPPLFTIVCTVFERANLFPHLLWSVLQQTFEDWELVVLEDGEHPRVRQAVDHLRERVPETTHNVTLVPMFGPQGRVGKYGNPLRRRGLELARGRYVCWVNHDNLLHPGFLKAHMRNFEDQPEGVSLVNVDYFTQEMYYMGKTPRGWRGIEALEAGDLDLLNFAVPAQAAREHGLFAPAHDALPAAWWPGLQSLMRVVPTCHYRATVAARF